MRAFVLIMSGPKKEKMAMPHVFSTLITGIMLLGMMAFFATHILKVAGKAVTNGDGAGFMRCLAAGVVMVFVCLFAFRAYAWSASKVVERELGISTSTQVENAPTPNFFSER